MLRKFLVVLLLCMFMVLAVVMLDFANLHEKQENENSKDTAPIVDTSKDAETSNEDTLSEDMSIQISEDKNVKVKEAIALVAKTDIELRKIQMQKKREQDVYEYYLGYAILNGIIEDTEFSSYDYDREITQIEFASMCYKIVDTADTAINNIEAIPNLDKQNKKYKQVEFLYKIGVVVGCDEFGTFDAETCVTGKQATEIISRIIYPEKRVKKEFITKEEIRYTNFKENVINQICDSNEIFVSDDGYTVSEENLDKLKAEIEKFDGVCGFYLVTLDGQFSIGYNIDQKISSASTVKAPYALYVVKQLESGNGTYDEIYEYKEENYRAGSGVIQHSPFGTKFTLEEILYHTINVSDNTGYYILQDRFGITGYNEFLEKIGCSRMKLTGGLRWGYVIPREAALVWNEIYSYSKTSEYGQKLFDLFINAEYNFIKQAYTDKYGSLNYEIAHKSGFNKDGRHDTAIVLLDDTPYFITITTKPNGREKSYFKHTAIILENIMREYVSQKSN